MWKPDWGTALLTLQTYQLMTQQETRCTHSLHISAVHSATSVHRACPIDTSSLKPLRRTRYLAICVQKCIVAMLPGGTKLRCMVLTWCLHRLYWQVW